MTTNIPQARKELREAMDILRDVGTLETSAAVKIIHSALSKMKRKQLHTNRRIVSKKITSEIVKAVKHQILIAPYLTDIEIAIQFTIGNGRVNEIRNGLRTVEHPTMKPNMDGYNRELADLKEGKK